MQECAANGQALGVSLVSCGVSNSATMTAAQRACMCSAGNIELFKKVDASCAPLNVPSQAAAFAAACAAPAPVAAAATTLAAALPTLAMPTLAVPTLAMPTMPALPNVSAACTEGLNKAGQSAAACSKNLTPGSSQAEIYKCLCTKDLLAIFAKLSGDCGGSSSASAYTSYVDQCKANGYSAASSISPAVALAAAAGAAVLLF
ncbi:hypothetical protein BDR26DRAFT_864206, partial [Obelidium mucronatum]